MTRRLSPLDALTLAVAAALLAGALWIGLKGPEGAVPLHFDIHGKPDRWGDRAELAWTVVAMGTLLLAGAGGLGWYAARTEHASRRRGLRIGQAITLVVVSLTAGMVSWLSLSGGGGAVGAPVLSMAFLGVVCLVVGAFLGRVPPNIAVGVRTPWAYKSRLAWDRSNRLAGRLMFWIGLIALLAAPIAPQPLGMTVAVASVLIAALWSVFESWRVWRADPDRQPF